MKAVFQAIAAFLIVIGISVPVAAQSDEPKMIFEKTTVWRMLSPDATLATFVIDDPAVKGVACYFTLPKVGGWKGWAGFAEERSETSIACRQVGPIKIVSKFDQGEEIYRERRSLFWKKMQIVRGCDADRNVLVYLAYSDRLIEGSPQNSTSTVPVMPWGDAPAPKCGEFVNP
jgi:CreA protein